MPRMTDTGRPARDPRPAPRRPVRRRRASPALRFALRLGAVGLVVVLLFVTAILSWQRGWVAQTVRRIDNAILDATAQAGFRVEEVLVEGRDATGRAELMSALGIDRGDPILAFDPHRAREAVAALPWVRSVRVERRLPDIVYVRLEERRPLALWQHDRQFSVIDSDGEVLTERDVGRFRSLPQVVGEDAPAHAAALLELLRAEPVVAERVSAAVRVGGRRWELRLDNRVVIHLPEDNVAQALHRLSELQTANHLFDRDLTVIDLRLGDRMVIRTTTQPPERRRQSQENT